MKNIIALVLLFCAIGSNANSEEKNFEGISRQLLPVGHWAETLENVIQSLKREGYELDDVTKTTEEHNKVVDYGSTTRHRLVFIRKSNTVLNRNGSPLNEYMQIEVMIKRKMSSPTSEPKLQYQIQHWN